MVPACWRHRRKPPARPHRRESLSPPLGIRTSNSSKDLALPPPAFNRQVPLLVREVRGDETRRGMPEGEALPLHGRVCKVIATLRRNLQLALGVFASCASLRIVTAGACGIAWASAAQTSCASVNCRFSGAPSSSSR